MIKRRGAAANIATLVFLIALFILFYVLLIPEDARKELLGDDFTKGTKPSYGAITDQGKSLLSASPGNVYALQKGSFSLPLTNAKLYVKDEEVVINLADSLTISKGLFSDSPRTLFFKIDNPAVAKKLNLFMFINEPSNIYIDLNGNRIFEGPVESANIPVTLPLRFVRQDNTLKIGLAGSYMLTKSLRLNSLLVKETFVNENRVATRSFAVSESELPSLRSAYLDYFVNCLSVSSRNQGELTLSFNNKILFSDVIDCDAAPRTIKLDTSSIKAGTNFVSFEISKGEYNLESMSLVLDVAEKFYPQYNFEVSDDDYKDIKSDCSSNDYDSCLGDCGLTCKSGCSGYNNYNNCYNSCFSDCEDECSVSYCSTGKDVILQLEFPNSRNRKIASITVNEDVISMDTVQDVFFRDISSSINRGANHIKIIPKNDFEVKALTVSIEPSLDKTSSSSSRY